MGAITPVNSSCAPQSGPQDCTVRFSLLAGGSGFMNEEAINWRFDTRGRVIIDFASYNTPLIITKYAEYAPDVYSVIASTEVNGKSYRYFGEAYRRVSVDMASLIDSGS